LPLPVVAGKVGGWKKYFTVEQNEMFDKFHAERMKGYEDIPFQFE